MPPEISRVSQLSRSACSNLQSGLGSSQLLWKITKILTKYKIKGCHTYFVRTIPLELHLKISKRKKNYYSTSSGLKSN